VREVGGEALPDNRALAERAEFVVLCHPPQHLEAVAAEIEGTPLRAVVSILSGVRLARLRTAYPVPPVLRFAVNLAVEAGLGTVCYVGGMGADERLEEEIVERFSRLGAFLRLDEDLIPIAVGLSGVGPAYFSLIAQAQVQSAVGHGLPAAQASELVLQTMAGTVAMLRRRHFDTEGLRSSVASPGGPTATGLAVLEKAGLREMFGDAMDAVVATVERHGQPQPGGPVAGATP